MPEQRGSDGRFVESVSDDDILFFFETGDRPFYGTAEVSENFDLSNEQAKRRLEALSDAGELEQIRMNDRQIAWWHERDVVVLRPETDGYSAHDTQVGVASAGDTRAEALRSLAEAIEVAEEDDLDGTALTELEDSDTDGCADGNPF
ncbi:type II toxin-antitoxin system HicB family antitoxin [Halobaculum sp. MBLA0143]|uniref:type II toxin-antitoxin system HicB family antitoxin n=1 Tax=Halobaculum sp. MBLA0143 TaxID=3079933 RepID=UPI003523D464